MKTQKNRIIALSGIFQSVYLVQQLAWTGKFDTDDSTAIIKSILTPNAESIEQIYPDLLILQNGLKSLIRIFESKNRSKKDLEIARYALALIYLERRLMKRQDLIEIIKTGISKVQSQIEYFPIMHDNVISNLANIYTDTISTFDFRVHISGEQNYLSNLNNTNKIRTFLLAGIRAAVLWRQMNGNRWQLFFNRRQIISTAREILNTII